MSIQGLGPAFPWPAVGRPGAASAAGAESFGELIAGAVARVESDQRMAEAVSQQLAQGEITDLAQVTLASEQAYLGLATLVQVRNKLLEAYQEFMRMQI